jgi:hypothetical protein
MRKLEKFQASIDESNLLKSETLKSVNGGRKLKSRYICGEDTGSNGKPCDTTTTVDCDYDDGTSSSDTSTSIQPC